MRCVVLRLATMHEKKKEGIDAIDDTPHCIVVCFNGQRPTNENKKAHEQPEGLCTGHPGVWPSCFRSSPFIARRLCSALPALCTDTQSTRKQTQHPKNAT